MAVTDTQPVSTGNLAAMLTSMASRMDGFMGAHVTIVGDYANRIIRMNVVSRSNVNVNADNGKVTLPEGTFLMSVIEGRPRMDGVDLAVGNYIIAGGKSYTFPSGSIDDNEGFIGYTITIAQLTSAPGVGGQS